MVNGNQLENKPNNCSITTNHYMVSVIKYYSCRGNKQLLLVQAHRAKNQSSSSWLNYLYFGKNDQGLHSKVHSVSIYFSAARKI